MESHEFGVELGPGNPYTHRYNSSLGMLQLIDGNWHRTSKRVSTDSDSERGVSEAEPKAKKLYKSRLSTPSTRILGTKRPEKQRRATINCQECIIYVAP
ncbi:hypothetical protein C5167_043074 [Papaver somniferum]|uniref:Uncharacterized protein n=1 Tax=Papaver somniferum TaxID=3469 RepID=A0A4Y7L8I9_PAPSO|nr:hypothetical protein C5167_043074 [Papaver somniferum]